MYFYQLVYYPALFLFVVFLYRWLKKQERRSFLDFYIQNRRDERSLQFKNISKYCSTLDSQKAKEITSWSYKEVKENLQKGRVSCEDVLKAFQQKAIEVDEKTNCVCLFIEDALDLARDLDKQAEDKNYVKPPLFGVPVSIKESIHIKGMDSTSGYVQDLNKPSEDDATVVKQLKKLGAVPFVHTNIPLSLCTYGCTNAIYGATGNPLDVNRVPGGSSGGEAALIALGGSVLGIGSDVGGSIRTPATFCGISGFKPSNLRVSHLGNPGGVPGRQMIIATEGPMAPHIDTCVDYLKLAWGDDFLSDFDPYVAPVKWQDDLYTSDKQLTIGFYTDDKFLKAAPANERVVRECASKLRALGHRVVPFEVPDGFRAFELMAVAVSADGGKFLNDKMGKDLVLPDSDFGFVARSPIAFQRLLSKILPWPRICRLLRLLPQNCEDQRKNIADIQAYRHTFITKMKEQNIDVLICPPMSIYPPEHLVPAQLLPATNYTSLYNLLDFGAGTVPITKVTKEDDEALKDYPENDPFDKKIKQQCQGMIGYPVGIQVAAPPFREEIALRVLKQLEDAYY